MKPQSVLNKVVFLLVNLTDNCILYPFTNGEGYGHIQYRNKKGKKERCLAHRLAYEVHNNIELTPEQLKTFATPGVARTLDMPIKFPGSNFRIPKSLLQFKEVIELVANYEATINDKCFDEYYCYMTVDQGWVKPETLQREAPCHVDGFQGARYNPKTKINHTYEPHI